MRSKITSVILRIYQRGGILGFVCLMLFCSLSSASTLTVDTYFPAPEVRYRKVLAQEVVSKRTEIDGRLIKYDELDGTKIVLEIATTPLTKAAFSAEAKTFTSDSDIVVSLFKPLTVPASSLNNAKIYVNAVEDLISFSDGANRIGIWPGLGSCERQSFLFLGYYTVDCGDGAYLAYIQESSGIYFAIGGGMGWASPLSAIGTGFGIKSGSVDYICCRLDQNAVIPIGSGNMSCGVEETEVKDAKTRVDIKQQEYNAAFDAAKAAGCFREMGVGGTKYHTNWPAPGVDVSYEKTWLDGTNVEQEFGRWLGCSMYTWECRAPADAICNGSCNTYCTCQNSACGCCASVCTAYCACSSCGCCSSTCTSYCSCATAACGCATKDPKTGACTSYNTCQNSACGCCASVCTGYCACSSCGCCATACTSYCSCATSACGCCVYNKVCCANPGEGVGGSGWRWYEDQNGACNRANCNSLISTLSSAGQALRDEKANYENKKRSYCTCVCNALGNPGEPCISTCMVSNQL